MNSGLRSHTHRMSVSGTSVTLLVSQLNLDTLPYSSGGCTTVSLHGGNNTWNCTALPPTPPYRSQMTHWPCVSNTPFSISFLSLQSVGILMYFAPMSSNCMLQSQEWNALKSLSTFWLKLDLGSQLITTHHHKWHSGPLYEKNSNQTGSNGETN